MSLQDELREALSPVVAAIMDEFPSIATITRREETLGDGNRPTWIDRPLANGTDARVLVQPPTITLVRKVFGRDVGGEAVMLVEDSVPLQAFDRVEVTAGPYAGIAFWVRQVTPGYMAGISTALLTTKRLEETS